MSSKLDPDSIPSTFICSDYSNSDNLKDRIIPHAITILIISLMIILALTVILNFKKKC
jgi:hypothetical protein